MKNKIIISKQITFHHLKKYISTIIIPISLLIYIFYKNIRAYMEPHFYDIFIIGTLDVIYSNNFIIWKLFISFLHCLMIIILFIFKPISVKNPLNGIFILYVIAIGIIAFHKNWPYVFTRIEFILLYSILLFIVLIIKTILKQID